MKKCPLCSSPKANLVCGICGETFCKACIERIDRNLLSFLSVVPAVLKHEHICTQCYDRDVAAEKQRCDELYERAKNVIFLSKNFRGQVRVLARHTKRSFVEQCDDRRECILRLAFFAAELNFNAIIDADIVSAKVRMGKYQTMTWKGSALSANVDIDDLEASALKGL